MKITKQSTNVSNFVRDVAKSDGEIANSYEDVLDLYSDVSKSVP